MNSFGRAFHFAIHGAWSAGPRMMPAIVSASSSDGPFVTHSSVIAS